MSATIEESREKLLAQLSDPTLSEKDIKLIEKKLEVLRSQEA